MRSRRYHAPCDVTSPTNADELEIAREKREALLAPRAVRRVFYNIVASSGEVIITTSASLRGRRPARYSVAKLNKLPQNWSRWPASLRRDAPAAARGDEVELGSLLGGSASSELRSGRGCVRVLSLLWGIWAASNAWFLGQSAPKAAYRSSPPFFQNSLACPTDRHHANHATSPHEVCSIGPHLCYACDTRAKKI